MYIYIYKYIFSVLENEANIFRSMNTNLANENDSMKRVLSDYSQEISVLDEQFRGEFSKREHCDDLIKHLTGELISAQTSNAALEGKLVALSEKAEVAERELSRSTNKNKALESVVNRLQVNNNYIYFECHI